MNSTHHTVHIDAPPARVYAALLDPELIPRWRVPEGMHCHVHEFEPREGGAFRVSLTYDAPDAAGKSSAHTDTYRGRFVQLVPGERVVEHLAFETADPQMQGEMRITTQLAPEGTGARLTAVHENLPPGVTPADNEAGWQDSLRKLAGLLEHAGRRTSPTPPPMQTDVILKRFEQPDEVRELVKGRFELVRIRGMTIGRATYEPGWRWSEHVGPGVGQARCSVEHVGIVLAGTATAAFADGRVVELRAGEVFYIPPEPHDSWVVGSEPYVSLHFLGADDYAR